MCVTPFETDKKAAVFGEKKLGFLSFEEQFDRKFGPRFCIGAHHIALIEIVVAGQDANAVQPSPPSCSLLTAGRCFAGTQNVSSLQKDEAWKVNVRIHGCDMEQGYLCGTMEALNVPLADTPVVTFWEGEIVDAKNYTFFTGKWEASAEDDVRHWSKFSSFTPLLSQIEADGGKSVDLSNYPFIFMRWKEQYFVNVGVDCGLTIAGFYYVCFSCSDGSISGFYYDPNSSPFQKLELKCTNEKQSGFTFSSYELQ
ncbi:glucose-induced degradation protein 4 [Hordeum vulgare]|nr:glucose-induced degradation protein 4 [Hordeum vulgare]